MKFIKITCLLLIAFLSLTLVACGGDDEKKNDAIVDDLERDEDGSFNPEYIDKVELNLWSVIGDPDKSVLDRMILRFNTEYDDMIYIKTTTVGHKDYYSALTNSYVNDYKNFPDICLMHNEKNIEYASKDYFRSVDEMIELIGIDFNFDQVYDNIEGTTVMDGKHYGIPIDAHGYLMQIRQDIIKKNGLGFEGNTRFTPNSYEEYEYLLKELRKLADSGELWTRSIANNTDHSWYQLKNGNPNVDQVVTSDTFYPGFLNEQESDLLTALYVNGGTLLNEEGKVNFHNSKGYVRYITDFVNRKNTSLYGDAFGGKEAAFAAGRIVFFSEGPWQTAGLYDFSWNNNQLIMVGERGVTAEDAADPVYSKPYTVCRSYWSANSEATTEAKENKLVEKWYGNGHVLTLNKKMTSTKKIAAALVFAQWLTQGLNEDGEYNLVEWCQAGHIPAWKNVYASNEYGKAVSKSLTLQALGDPANIITLESTPYASTLVSGVVNSFGLVLNSLLSDEGCTVDEAVSKINATANSTQQVLDLLKLGLS